jgi:hypothetical protein
MDHYSSSSSFPLPGVLVDERFSRERNERRKARNRASQRAFRCRQETKLKEATEKADRLQVELDRHEQLQEELQSMVSRLQNRRLQLERENELLRAMVGRKRAEWEGLGKGTKPGDGEKGSRALN